MIELTKQRLKILGISSGVLTAIFVILIIVIPINIKTNEEEPIPTPTPSPQPTPIDYPDYTNNTMPKINNTDLWGKFPGLINSSIEHSIGLLNYKEDQKFEGEVNIEDKFTLIENIDYNNFNESENKEKIKFEAYHNYSIKQNNEVKTKSLSMGLFEMLETLSNPPLYKKGINGILYLNQLIIEKSDIFLRQLYTHKMYKTIQENPEIVPNEILKEIPEEIKSKIINKEKDEKYKDYDFNSYTNFYKWIQTIGKTACLSNDCWQFTIFGLNKEQLDTIIGKEKYLYLEFIKFNAEIANQFKCNDETKCGREILYKQFVNNCEVTKFIGFNTLVDLYNEIEPEFYPFISTPELSEVFNEYKKKIKDETAIYDDYKITEEVFEKLISENQISLQSAENSVKFLNYVNSKNYEKALEYFNLNEKQLDFANYYFYDFIPNLYIYLSFTKDTTNYKINPLSKSFTYFTQHFIDNTYGSLYSIEDPYKEILNKLVIKKLINKVYISSIVENENADLNDELCDFVMQNALDDGKKVSIICDDSKLSFRNSENMYQWIQAYPCIISGDETKCDMSIIERLKSLVYITNDEIKKIYSEEFFGGAIENSEDDIKNAYKCGEKCEKEYLLKMQYWQSFISLNVPKPLTENNTLFYLFPELISEPVEISYFESIYGTKFDLAESDIDFLISLRSQGADFFSEDNRKSLLQKLEFEKEYTLYMEGNLKNDDHIKAYNLINYMLSKQELGETIYTEYSRNELLQGNKNKDKQYIDFLKNYGNYYDNFKPNLEEIIGFNFGINLDDGSELYNNKEIDNYEITANKQRQITQINEANLFDVQKQEYNYIKNEYNNIHTNTFNFAKIDESISLNEGYQFDHDQNEIFYYDLLSQRPYKFTFLDYMNKDNRIVCKKYILDTEDLVLGFNEVEDLNSTKALFTQKLNKPFMVSVTNDDLSVKIKDYVNSNSYICVDISTNFVVESDINFIYSLYTKNYNYLYSNVLGDKVCPIFTYQRHYDIDVDSYLELFPRDPISSETHSVEESKEEEDKDKNKKKKVAIIVVFAILIVIFAGLTLFFFYKLHNKISNDELNQNIENANESLVPRAQDTVNNEH